MEKEEPSPEKENPKQDSKMVRFLKKPVFLLLILLFALILFLSYHLWQNYRLKTEFEQDYLQKASLNEKQVFSISKIYCYSSGAGEANQTNKPQWDLAVSQYTDIAIYLQSDTSTGATQENTIQKMAIYDISISNNEEDKADLYFKDLSKFATFAYSEENRIDGTLNYEIINTHELDYSKPQIYLGANNPITVQYVRKDIKDHYMLKDLTEQIQFDGHLLRQASIPISAMESNLSFKIQIVNWLGQEFVAQVHLPIPLEDGEKSIYDGSIVKEYLNPAIQFYRTK